MLVRRGGTLSMLSEVHRRLDGLHGGLAQRRRRRVGDIADVGTGEFGQRLVGARRRRADVVAGQAGLQLADRAEAGVHVRVGHRGLQVSWDRRRADPPPSAAGQVQLTLEFEPGGSGSGAGSAPGPFEDVVIQLAERNPAVLVPVRISGDKPLDQGGGEH